MPELPNKLLCIIAFFAIGTLFSGCNKEDIPKDLPNCIQDKIKAILDGPVWNPPARVIEYDYLNRTVYYFPVEPFCCDNTSEAYNNNCELVCMPEGGANNLGDGECPDFFQLISGGVIVWEDSRES